MKKSFVSLSGFLGVFFLLSTAQAFTLEEQTSVYDSYALEAKGQIGKAIERMVALSIKHGNDYFTNYRLGYLFSIDKKYKNSIEHYQKAATSAPTSVEPWLALSSLQVNLLDYAGAVASSTELLKRDPNNYYGLLRLTLSYIRLKNYQPAVDNANRSLQLYPIDPIFLEQKAFALAQMGRQDEARTVISTLILISPRNEFARTFTIKK